MHWIPESYPRAGGLAAAGFYKLLGRPRMDPLTVLVRETAQNSWDARIPNGDPVHFAIQGRTLSTTARNALREEVFPDALNAVGTGLSEALNEPEVHGMFISDRNTKGLSGPFYANEADPTDEYDWVDFVLNVGKANNQGFTGGTYGFGKTISYVTSRANAIVIHTQTVHAGQSQTRLIACAIGDDFKYQGQLYTGRHWWGNDDDGSPVPLVDSDADRVANLIGMPEFAHGSTGTNILIVAPDTGGRTPRQAMTFIAESITWHLWPKLMVRAGQGTPPMRMHVSWDDEEIPIPKPEDRPPLHGFAQAFQAILSGDESAAAPGTRIEEVRCQRPSTIVGDLATVPLIHRPRAVVDDGADMEDNDPPPAAVITGPCHHVALLRTPELVIEYVEGPAPVEGGTEWAGVFRARDAHDGKLARSEPPTHDSWNPTLLPKSPERTIINVALREIKRILESRWGARTRMKKTEAGTTAFVADELSHLVRSVESRGPGRRQVETTRSAGRRLPKVDVVWSGPELVNGSPVTVARIRLSPVASTSGTTLHIKVGAALDGKDVDIDLDPGLALVEARLPDGAQALSGLEAALDFHGTDIVELDIVVARSGNTTVLFDLQSEVI